MSVRKYSNYMRRYSNICGHIVGYVEETGGPPVLSSGSTYQELRNNYFRNYYILCHTCLYLHVMEYISEGV